MVYAFSLPTKADQVPGGLGWLHEIKYDGYRMMVIRDGDRVQLISRGGHDWARYFPRIVTAALKLRQDHFVIDGELVFSTRTACPTSTRCARECTTSGRSSIPST